MAGNDADGSAETNGTLQTHALQHSWCVWVLQFNQSSKDKDSWQSSQMRIGQFSTVEDFWRLFNNLKRPSKLGTVDFSFFKKEVVPDWDDETCIRGGRWLAKLEGFKPRDLDDLWLSVILTVIGEGFGEAGHLISGVVVASRRKDSKIALWLSDQSDEAVGTVGEAFQKVLQDAGFRGEINFEKFGQKADAQAH